VEKGARTQKGWIKVEQKQVKRGGKTLDEKSIGGKEQGKSSGKKARPRKEKSFGVDVVGNLPTRRRTRSNCRSAGGRTARVGQVFISWRGGGDRKKNPGSAVGGG